MMVQIDEGDLNTLLSEKARLAERAQELLKKNTELVLRARSAGDIEENVREFMEVCEQYTNIRPTANIPDGVKRLRMRLIVEETFETIVAIAPAIEAKLMSLCREVMLIIDHAPELGQTNLPAVADGTVDLDYVSEGCRRAFGISGAPILAAVHAANMTKASGPTDPSTGKRLKPPGFQPPDVASILREQGWDDTTP